MKTISVLIILFLVSNLVFSQEYIYEDFGNTSFPPSGWGIAPNGSQWDTSYSSFAGGSAPEACFEGFVFSGTARFFSPYIDLSGQDTVLLTFKNFAVINDTTGLKIGVATRSQSIWESIWEVELTENYGPRDIDLLITNQSVGQPYFQFSFYLSGDLSSIDRWYIDNIHLYFPSYPDCKMQQILTPDLILGPVPCIGLVRNLGNTTLNEVSVSYESYGGVIHDTTITGLDLGLFGYHVFSFDRKWVSPPGNSDLKMWINSVNGQPDGDQSNDTLVKNIKFGYPEFSRRPMFEEFTDSDCSIVPNFHAIFTPFCNDHPDITHIKYALMGDPYFIEDCRTRFNYYGASSPFVYVNGAFVNNNMHLSSYQHAYDSAITLKSPFEIVSYFNIEDSTINITTGIIPHENVYDMKIHTALIEKTVYGNVGANGETEHYQVVMKMFPDGYGESADFYNLIPHSQSFTADLRGTFIEELDDLLLAVFIQENDTKFVLQSAYAFQDTLLSSNAYLQDITVDNVSIPNFEPHVFDYFIEVPHGILESPVVDAAPANANARVSIVQAFVLPGHASIDVYSEDRTTWNRYSVYLSYATSTPESEGNRLLACDIYPNPSAGAVRLRYLIHDICYLKSDLYMISGEKIRELINGFVQPGEYEMEIDVSDLPAGIYLLKLQLGDEVMVRKLVVGG